MVYLPRVKTIRHQSFTILSPVLYCKNLMVIVNASHQNFDNAKKIGRKKSQPVFSLVIRAILHNPSFANIAKNLQTIPQKFKTTRTHYFISQRSYLNISPITGQSTLWWPLPDNLIKWIFLNAEGFKNFFNRKNTLYRKSYMTVPAETTFGGVL